MSFCLTWITAFELKTCNDSCYKQFSQVATPFAWTAGAGSIPGLSCTPSTSASASVLSSLRLSLSLSSSNFYSNGFNPVLGLFVMCLAAAQVSQTMLLILIYQNYATAVLGALSHQFVATLSFFNSSPNVNKILQLCLLISIEFSEVNWNLMNVISLARHNFNHKLKHFIKKAVFEWIPFSFIDIWSRNLMMKLQFIHRQRFFKICAASPFERDGWKNQLSIHLTTANLIDTWVAL